MRAFFDPVQLAHAPAREVHNGGWIDYSERVSRAQSIVSTLGPPERAQDHGLEPILAVHDADYVAFLQTAHDRWRESGRAGDAMAYTFPVVGRRRLPLDRIDALVGYYGFDASTPIAGGTWAAAYASAQTALTALDVVLAGESSAFALCRPPGHHAGADYAGGYCYLNNAAIAAQSARQAGRARVAVLDVDYHHGNGTQDIFWRRADVFYASIHADPATDYPFYWGYADETGEGEGQGANLNLPLPLGTGGVAYQQALATALDAIERYAPELLILSFGADTWDGDPISGFALKTSEFTRLSQAVAARGWPTLIVMEGGYAVEALGDNVAAFLSGF